MTRTLARCALLLWTHLPLCVLCASSVRAQPAQFHSYAVIVGSNPGGPGQPPLGFAERDARHIASGRCCDDTCAASAAASCD